MDEHAQTPEPGKEARMPEPHKERPSEPRKDDNVVYIGKKGLMGYVLAVVTNFNRGSTEVIVKARGHLISRAVDVEEIVKHRFMPDIKIKEVRVTTEKLQSHDGRESNVSSLELVLSK